MDPAAECETRGLADRAPSGEASRVPDYSRDARTFQRSVANERAILDGHSLGGLVAAWTAAHAPDLVAGLFLEAPRPRTAPMPRYKETISYTRHNAVRNVLEPHIASGASIDDLAQQMALARVDEGVTMLYQLEILNLVAQGLSNAATSSGWS